MKKRCFSFLSCICVVVLSGCSKGPSDTAESFFAAIEKKDYEKACSYVSEDDLKKSQSQVKVSLVKVKSIISMMPAEAVEKIIIVEDLANRSAEDFFVGMMKMAAEEGEELFICPEILKEKVDGDKATVWCKDAEGKEDQMELVKENGRWVMLFSPPQE